MSTKETGGPAFPRPAADFCESQVGMTLRDYFAGQALAVMCASNVSETGTFATPDGRNTAASVCYHMADAMLKARES